MPLRVKCRCGQELVLRYGEWVYLLVGLVLVAVFLNTSAVILLYIQLHDDKDEARGRETAAAETAPSPDPPEATRAVAGNADGDALPLEEESPLESTQGEHEDPPGRGSSPARSGDSGPVAPRQLGQRRAAAPRRSLLEQLKLLAPASVEPLKVPGQPGAISARHNLVEGPPLIRLLLLRRATNNPDITHALLLDPDPRLRLAAMEQTLARPSLSPTLEERIRPLVIEAADFLRGRPRGRELLRRFKVPTDGSRNNEPAQQDSLVSEHDWEELQSTAESILTLDPGSARLRELLDAVERSGSDLLLAVDTTKSMEGALLDLKAVARWLLPALDWGAPEMRVGLLLYKDEVQDVFALSTSPATDILPQVLGLQAEGGDRPPEGLYAALRTSLELGNVGWRPEAAKHIVFVGDAPLPRSDKLGFESLAAAAHREAGFLVHTLGVQPQEGREAVPYFVDLARSGGGRSATCDRITLGMEVLACLFGDVAREPMGELIPDLQGLFGSSEE